MRAIALGERLEVLADVPVPERPAGEALVRVSLAGICNTDLEIIKGYLGFRGVLGHEFVGLVQEADDQGLIGARVVGEINVYCGQCEYCADGMFTHCLRRTVLGIHGRHGAMAEYLVLPERNLHRVPASVTDSEAVFTEPLAAALEILEQTRVKPSSEVVVIGDGKLGLLVAQVLALTGARVVALGRHSNKLAILAERGIETHGEGDAYERKADVVVECTGHPGGFLHARSLVKPRGTIVLKSTYHDTSELALSPMVVDEVSLLGSRCGPFAPALRLLQRRLVDVESLISAVYPLERGLEAFEAARKRDNIKVLLSNQQTGPSRL
ncbi:MAG: alcohol dehydrogenase catalytic domain-containing protein [Chloroflexota bacterium]